MFESGKILYPVITEVEEIDRTPSEEYPDIKIDTK